MTVEKYDDTEANYSESLCIDGWAMEPGNVNWSFAEAVWTVDKDVLYDP